MTGVIVCALRGGQASHRTQARAIQLAAERRSELIFLYVVDAQFVEESLAPEVVDVEAELTRVGDFVLAWAVERAMRDGLTVRGEMRSGPVRDVLADFVREVSPGRWSWAIPGPSRAVRSFPGELRTYAEGLRQVRVEVVIV